MSDGDNATPGHGGSAERTNAISVAELIAKVGSSAGGGRHARHYREDDKQPAPRHHSARFDAVTDSIPPVREAETPDIDVVRRRRAEALGETIDATTTFDEATGFDHTTTFDEATGFDEVTGFDEATGLDYPTVFDHTTVFDYPTGLDHTAVFDHTTSFDHTTMFDETTTLPAADGEEETDSAPTDFEPGPTRRRSAMVGGRLAAAVLSVIALALTGTAWQWSASKNSRLNTISALDPDSRDIVDPNAQFGDENFLVAGVDSRLGANGDMGAGDTSDADGVRSDTVMLVNIPASRKRVVEVSFPRDLAITPILCDAWDPQTRKYGPVYNQDTHSFGPAQVYTETKLNSAYAFGGPKCLVKEIQKLSGLSINHFIAVDFAGFAKMVDAVGGVKVCSTTPLQDNELGTVLEHAGWQTVDGRTALNYVRARQVTTEVNGDYGRIKRQQLFLSSLLRAMISNEVFFSLKKLNDVVNTFISNSSVDNVKTKDLVNLGQSIQGMSAGRVTFLTVPTGKTDSDGNEPLRIDDNRALFDAIINDDPLPGENNQNETTTPTRTPQASNTPPTNSAPSTDELVNAVTAEPQSITVHVSNSTGQEGLGASAASGLAQHGFKVLTPDNYPSVLPSTTVFFSSGHEQAAATVASTLPNPQIERVSGMGEEVRVVLGQDFNAVNAPPPSGSSVQVHVGNGDGAPPTNLPQDLSVTNAADVSCQ